MYLLKHYLNKLNFTDTRKTGIKIPVFLYFEKGEEEIVSI